MTKSLGTVLAALFVVSFSGCAIKMSAPDFEYPEPESVEAAKWPKLVHTQSLKQDISVSEKPAIAATTALQSKADGMRARANALKGPLISPEERRKLEELRDQQPPPQTDS